jgi:hypothetical protein
MAGPSPGPTGPTAGPEAPEAPDMAPVCRICLDAEGALIQPCGCQGSMKWVHAECLAQWWHHRWGRPGAGLWEFIEKRS